MNPKIKKLDAVFSQYIRLRDSDENGICKCCTCGALHHWKQMDNGHFIKRQHMALRFSEVNCNVQCRKCNWLGQGEDAKYKEFIIKKYGVNTYNQLLIQKNTSAKFASFELDFMIAKYKDYVKSMLTGKG